MNCPDLTAIARAGTLRSDPEVENHVKSCPSCWLDWQVMTGVRLLAEAEARERLGPHDPGTEKAAAMVLPVIPPDDPVTWGQHAGSVLLVAASVVLFIFASGAF